MKQFALLQKLLVLTAIFVTFLVTPFYFYLSKAAAIPNKSELLRATFKFTAINTIQMDAGGETYYFVDNDPYDSNFEYRIRDYKDGYGRITLTNGYDIFGVQGSSGSAIRAYIDIDHFPNETATAAIDDDELERNIVVSDAAKVRTIMRLDPNNPDVMTRVGDDSWRFERIATDSEPFLYRRSSEQGSACQDVAVVSGGRVTVYELRTGGNPKAPGETGDTACQVVNVNFLDVNNNPSVSVLGNGYATLFGPFIDGSGSIITSNARAGLFGASQLSGVDPTAAPVPPSADGADELNDNSCEGNSGVFGFIMCPLLRLVDEGLVKFDEYIYSSLTVDRTFIVGDTENQQIRDVWISFRNIAYIVLIPIMLVMVIGTALNFQIFDAYTVKRALPRLLISIIFISLSFNLCILMIDVVNTVGAGVGGLVAQPWGGVENLRLTDVFGGGAEESGGAAETTASIVVLGGLAFYAISGVTIVGLLISIGLAFLTIFIIFAVLALRELVIVFLVVLSPIAIIAWIFPGNDKPWKLWWNTFSKLLMLYPIIAGLIMLGRGFAKTIDATGQDDVLFVTTLIKIAAYVGPYFFIPKAFQLAGSAFGNLAGMVNDRSKGVFDRGRKKRAEATAEARQKNKNFSRFSDNNKLGRGVNSLLGATGSWQGAKSMRSADTFRAARDAGQRNQGLENLKKDPTWPEIENNDAALAALADMDFAEQKLAKARAKFTAAQAAGDADGMRNAQAEIENREKGIALAKQVGTRNTSATRRAALTQLSKTGYQFSAGREGYNELDTIASSIAGGDAGAKANIMNESQYHLKNAGRFDLGGINHGAGFDADAGLGKASLHQIASGKKESITTMGTEAVSSGMSQESLVAHKELKAMLPYATGGNAKEIEKQIRAIEGMYNSAGTSVEEYSSTAAPSTQYKPRRITFDQGRAMTDPSYAAQFNAGEQAQGWKMDSTPVTLGDLASNSARAYQPPDPNTME